jgi:hypothetical protein
MNELSRWLWLVSGLVLGAVSAGLYLGHPRSAQAGNDRYGDYILCTGPVALKQGGETDGVWLLDSSRHKLLGTVVARKEGKIVGWAEVDLGKEFGVKPKQNVHFMMTTGSIAKGQAALYVAETTTGKFGIYTMGPRPDDKPGVAVRRHDMVLFRQGRNP